MKMMIDKRKFLCYDNNGYIRSLLHIEKIYSHFKITLYVVTNKVINFKSAKWAFLQVNNSDEDFIVEHSLFIKPFALNVESNYYGEEIFYPHNLYENELEEIIMKRKFVEAGYTIKEYKGKKFDDDTINISYCSPKELKLEL